VFGSIIAYVLVKSPPKIKNFMMTLTSIPLTFSGLIIAFSFIVMLGSSGTLTLVISKVFKIKGRPYWPAPSCCSLFLWELLAPPWL
jgi:ABC-type uncharacterized transport system permease subunit